MVYERTNSNTSSCGQGGSLSIFLISHIRKILLHFPSKESKQWLRHTTHDTEGFTLIELLITISVFSITILGLYSTFHTGIFSYNRLEASLSAYQTARRILNRMDLDIKNAFPYSNEETKFIGEKDKLSFLTLVGSDFSSVSYEKKEDTLLRLCKRGWDSLKEDSSIKPRLLAKNMKDIRFSYGFFTDDEKIYDWKDTWGENDEERKKLPLAVKINLILKENIIKEEREVKFEKDVFLHR